MMNKFYSIIFALLSTYTISSLSHYNSEVIASSPDYCFDIQFSALFLKPSGSNLNYAAQGILLPITSPNWNIAEIQPRYYFGFDLAFQWIFNDIASNAIINWEHFNSTSCAAIRTTSENSVGPFFEMGEEAIPFSAAQGTAKFNLDKVDLLYGQMINFGERLQANLFGGVSVAIIKQALCSIYSSADGTDVRNIQTPSKFIGAGPEFGFNFSYEIMCDFALVGASSISIYAGKIQNYTQFSSSSPLLAQIDVRSPNIQTICVPNRFQIVPGFQEGIGLAYSYYTDNDILLKIEAGYQAQIFMNALQSVDINGETTPPAPTVVSPRSLIRTVSNFALAGPYITFDIGF